MVLPDREELQETTALREEFQSSAGAAVYPLMEARAARFTIKAAGALEALLLLEPFQEWDEHIKAEMDKADLMRL